MAFVPWESMLMPLFSLGGENAVFWNWWAEKQQKQERKI